MLRRKRSYPRRLLVVGVAIALTFSGGQVAVADPEPDPPPSTGAEPVSVTLITGDRVVMPHGEPPGRIVPGPGRDDLTFSTFTRDDHHFVVPSDAAARLGAGLLDERLFDVTQLLEYDYDDASRDDLPLLITFADGHDGSADISSAPGAQVDRTLSSINGVAVTEDKASATQLWGAVTGSGPATAMASGIEKIWLDGQRQSTLDVSVPQIGTPTAWDAGFTGAGTRIAVLDSGVDESHPDLADREVVEQNFTAEDTTDDLFGHGTHVASIAAGTGAASDGTYRGVAYEAEIVDGRVLNRIGRGRDSWIIAGMEWAAGEQDADVVNMSLGGFNSPEIDPMEQAVNALSAEHGTLFAIAAGNDGPRTGTVGSPASAEAALAVGAVNDDNELAEFSSRGPLPGNRLVKPNITAPGVGIVAARSSNGTIGDPVNENYTELDGTSMAAPHVAGSAALVRQQHPDLTGAQLKSILMGSSTPTEGLDVFEQGAGRVDLAAAVTTELRTEPSTVDFGVQRWPHHEADPVTTELTYVNSGDTESTVEFTVEATGPGGSPAPEGVFSFSEPALTIPANGSANVTVIGDVTAASEDGNYAGVLIARSGESTLRTTVGLYREPESYDLTLNHIGPDGQTPDMYFTQLYSMRTGEGSGVYEEDGSVTLRLRRGTYLVNSVIISGPTGNADQDLLAYPKLVLDRDKTVDLDARLAKPLQVSLPDADATSRYGEISYTRKGGERTLQLGLTSFRGDLERIGTAHLGPQLPRDKLRSLVNTQWTSAEGAKYYGLAWYVHGKVPTGFVRMVRPSDVATVRTDYGRIRQGTTATAGAFPSPHLQFGYAGRAGTRMLDIEHPTTRTEYYNTGDGSVDWNRMMFISEADPGRFVSQLQSPPRQFQPGRHYTESFNKAVFGPVLPLTYDRNRWIVRDGDTIRAETPMSGDGAGNWGRSAYDFDSSYTRLYRGGEPVEEQPGVGFNRFDVRPGRAEFRLEVSAHRPGFDLSTRATAKWTFTSDTTEGPTRLPISTIRYFPRLDDANSAPSGVSFVVPVAVQRQATSWTRVPYRLSAEVSYDSGQTWSSATVVANSQLVLQHPHDAETVSLRTTAVDGNGNSVEQTTIHAYKLR